MKLSSAINTAAVIALFFGIFVIFYWVGTALAQRETPDEKCERIGGEYLYAGFASQCVFPPKP